jgi:hypothetical protein
LSVCASHAECHHDDASRSQFSCDLGRLLGVRVPGLRSISDQNQDSGNALSCTRNCGEHLSLNQSQGAVDAGGVAHVRNGINRSAEAVDIKVISKLDAMFCIITEGDDRRLSFVESKIVRFDHRFHEVLFCLIILPYTVRRVENESNIHFLALSGNLMIADASCDQS